MVSEFDRAAPPQEDEIVDARFIPDDQSSEFTITQPVMRNADGKLVVVEQAEDFTGQIRFGAVIRMRRDEALARQDFQIVGEEDSTTSPLAHPQARPVVAAQEEPGERSVVAPPPALSTSATAPADDDGVVAGEGN